MVPVSKFGAKPLRLAHDYVYNFYRLSPEEQTVGNNQSYSDGNKNAFEIFKNISQVVRTLQEEGIATDKSQVTADIKNMAQRFRDKACVEDDAQSEYARKYKPFKRHECLYATLFLEYIKAAQQCKECSEEFKHTQYK